MRLLLLLIAASLLATAADRELTGKVVDANTGEPVAHARVTLRVLGNASGSEVVLASDRGRYGP